MYFKERQKSQLYKREQKQQQLRLNNKIQQIKKKKLKMSESENYLPPITHRVSHVKPFQIAAEKMQTERLKKRILQLKTKKSDYFSRVLKINLSRQSIKLKRGDSTQKTQLSFVKSQQRQNFVNQNSKHKTVE